ncbi:MAG: hypothetical protein M1817_000726 [Caeruleum heppii]|nr:MAG: hypothetical protein M1817_000726 [Caeruleum heppii]
MSDQPHQTQGYINPQNPTTHKPSETKPSSQQSPFNTSVATRGPHDQPDAQPTPSSLGAGSTKPDNPNVPDADDLDGEQMRATGEGEIMEKQWNKTGMGEQGSLTSDLDRQKEEQRGKREAVMQSRSEGVDVDGALGQSGGPATVEGR